MANAKVRERSWARSELADVEPYRAPQLDAPVKLNTNESPYPPPPSFVEDLQRRIGSLSLNRYPPRDFSDVRVALGEKLGSLTDRIWLANGSNELFLQILLAFGGAERKVMTFEPSYLMHSHLARVTGSRHLRARRNPDFTLDLEASVKAVKMQDPDLVFLCSPNNPTGNSCSQEELEAISESCRGLVILDEAYIEFDGPSRATLMENHPNLVITGSFSKAWRLAGARLGYLIAHPDVIADILKVRLPYNISSLTQAAALTAIDHFDELRSTIQTIVFERDKVYRELATTKGVLPYPSKANFVLFRCLDVPAADVWKGLLDEGVLVRDFSEVAGCEGCLRVSIGNAEQNERFLEAVSRVAVLR